MAQPLRSGVFGFELYVGGMDNAAGVILGALLMTLIPEKFQVFQDYRMGIFGFIILLMLGCFMEGIAIILLTVPIFMPVMTKLGVDPVHFGLIITLNSMVGLLTPPVGMVLYTMASVSKLSVMDLAHELRWHMVALALVLFLITYVPVITTFIPNLLMGAAG